MPPQTPTTKTKNYAPIFTSHFSHPSPAALRYNPLTSTWLSVDPLSDKYPGLSPYVYCANNPVILKDPDGRDIWTIYEDGTIERQKNKVFDRIDIIDEDGNVIHGTEAKYGTIKQHTITTETKKIDYFDVNDDALAKETFENIADNTSLEWTHAKIGEVGSNRNIIGTSHEKGSTIIGMFLLKTGYTLREINHNHTSGIPYPSGLLGSFGKGDLETAKDYETKFPTIKLNIYVSGKGSNPKGYYQYNQNGVLWGFVVTPK